MAKSQDIMIVYGEAFGAESPRVRQDKATEIVSKAMSKGAEPPPTKTVENLAFDDAPHLATVTGAIKRNMDRMCLEVSYRCKACGMQWADELPAGGDAYAFHSRMRTTIEFTHPETQSFGDRHWCSQCPQEERMIDGLTARECLLAYETWQRADSWAYQVVKAYDGSDCVWWKTHHTLERLTPLQLAAARTAWSVELKKRQAAAREKERVAVVCDWQDEP